MYKFVLKNLHKIYSMLNIYKLKKNNIKENIKLNQGILLNESKYKLSSSKEWYNSVYSFNKKNQNFLASINVSIYKIMKSYFNMFSIKLEKSILLRRVAKWKRRLKLNRILIGKPEFKHSNDKVIITLYVYNRELLLLKKKIKSLKNKILIEFFFKLFMNNKLMFTKIITIKNTLKKIQLLKKQLKNIYKKKVKNLLKKKIYLILRDNWDHLKLNYSKKKIKLAKSLNILEKKLEKSNSEKVTKNLYIWKYINNKNLYNKFSKSLNMIPKFKLSKLMYLNLLKKMLIRIRLYLRYHKIIFFNKSKFSIHMIPLKIYLEKLYKKQVEFNIINLKNYKLDSNILTEIMVIKLRNRKNRLNKIIRKILSKIKLPLSRRLEYKNYISKDKIQQNLLIKSLINKNIYNMIPGIKLNTKISKLNLIELNYDKLDTILKILHPMEYTMSKININKSIRYILKRDIKNTTLDNMENKVISGIRVEASGRLSKRIIASKSIFKVNQKGTIRNINSSYKKLPTMLLRGNFKSNLQYSISKGKTRIGAFGIKGWISSI